MRKQKLYSGSGGICLNVFLRMVALVCCLIVTVGVQAYAQEQRTLTAEFKDTPLAEVLKKLEKLSSYKILFTYDDVQNYKVTASLKDVTITEALQKVLADKPFSFSDITGGKYISVVYRPSEKFEAMKTIKGQVVDDKGESLIGATIRVVPFVYRYSHRYRRTLYVTDSSQCHGSGSDLYRYENLAGTFAGQNRIPYRHAAG